MPLKYFSYSSKRTKTVPHRINKFLRGFFGSFWRSALAILVGSTFLISGCSTQAKTEAPLYPTVYQTITEQKSNDASKKPETVELEIKFANFIELFKEFKKKDMRPGVESVYAEELYFNDTLHTFSSRDVMLEYMQETADRVDYTNVEIKDIVQSGDDYYVRWAMDVGFDVLGKQIKTHSIGMTHVRFDESGKINFHQDFWDNTEGFFRHLPVIGFLINKSKDRL